MNYLPTDLFLQNKYHRWYYNIIESAKSRGLTTRKQAKEVIGYVENHHIYPKALFPELIKDKSNLIFLTAREHFICHWLLAKMVYQPRHQYQMWNAISAMLYWHQPLGQRIKISSKIYQNLKLQVSHHRSLTFSGPNNPMFGQTHSDEAKKKIIQAHTGKIVSDDTKEKLSRRLKGRNNTWSSEVMKSNNPNNMPGVRDKMRTTFLEKYGVTNSSLIPVTCEHCGKKLGIANFKRWHGDKCKLRNTDK